jgi:hypothetical protein
MTPTPTMYTSPTQLDGTITGMIVTVIIATLGLVILIGVVFWAANHPDIKPPKGAHPMRKVHGAPPLADPHGVAPNSYEPVNSSNGARPGTALQTTYEVADAARSSGEVNEDASRSV